MVFKDLEGTKQARKELAEKESKVLLSLQGGKPAKPKSKPTLIETINVAFEDYKQFQSMFKDDFDSEADNISGPMYIPKIDTLGEMNHLKALLEEELEVNDSIPAESFLPYMNVLLEAEMEVEEASPGSFSPYTKINNKSPTYLVFKKKMEKLQKRNLLKSLIKKHANESFDLSLVDNALNDEQVEDMIKICLKLEQGQGESNLMPTPPTNPFGKLY